MEHMQAELHQQKYVSIIPVFTCKLMVELGGIL